VRTVSNLSPRSASSTSPRRRREQRAYKLVRTTAGLALLTVIAFIAAILGVVSGGAVVLTALLTGGSGYALKRTLSPPKG
jgi:hypothetical protein